MEKSKLDERSQIFDRYSPPTTEVQHTVTVKPVDYPSGVRTDVCLGENVVPGGGSDDDLCLFEWNVVEVVVVFGLLLQLECEY